MRHTKTTKLKFPVKHFVAHSLLKKCYINKWDLLKNEELNLCFDAEAYLKRTFTLSFIVDMKAAQQLIFSRKT